MTALNFEKTEGADRELKLTPFDSELWEICRGAYGNVVNDVKLLTGDEKELDDWDMALLDRRQCRQGKKEDMENIEKIARENLMEGLMHQMTFYEATYLAMPYLVHILEKKQDDDVEEQIAYITDMGFLVSTDVPDDTYRDTSGAADETGEVMENYHLSLLKLQEFTKRFLEKHLEEIKQMGNDTYYKEAFLTAVFAILSSDRRAAFVFSMSDWGSIYMGCQKCGDCNENIEIDEDEPLENICEAGITPAASVLGEWDGSSLDNDYLWFSNLLSMAGADRDAELTSYYYGTYKCSECGNTGLVMDFAKNYYFEEEEGEYEDEDDEDDYEEE